MEKFERVRKLHQIFSDRRTPIKVPDLMEKLGASRASVYRDIEFLRDFMCAPLENSEKGYFYDRSQENTFELPGVWMNADELNALLAVQAMLSQSQSMGLSDIFKPLNRKINEILTAAEPSKTKPAVDRLRVLPHQTRLTDDVVFRTVATAVLSRRQLSITYSARSTMERTTREVSPQLLTYYRDSWYLDAWDVKKKGMRRFSVDRIVNPKVLDQAATEVDQSVLDQHAGTGYGIFSGKPNQIATMVFSKRAAEWVSDQFWHRDQQTRTLPDGRFELKLPYSSEHELLQDILSHSDDVEVISPISLREQVKIRLQLALASYK